MSSAMARPHPSGMILGWELLPLRMPFLDYLLFLAIRWHPLLTVGISDYESWDLGLRQNLYEAEILGGLSYPHCYNLLLDPWWMTHGNGTWTNMAISPPNHSHNTLPHMEINKMLLYIKSFGEVPSQKRFVSFYWRPVIRISIKLMFLSRRLLVSCLLWVGVFCHKCGKSIMHILVFCDFAQSRWMRISSYFNYHVVFPNDPLILLNMLFIGHGLRCVCASAPNEEFKLPRNK